MKKRIYSLLILVMLLSLSACGTDSAGKKTAENTNVNETVGTENTPSQTETDVALPKEPSEEASEESSDELPDEPSDKLSDASSGELSEELSDASSASTEGIDVDLTQLSSTMVYSEVYNMLVIPDDYIGKTIKMKGQFSVYQDEATNNIYYAVIIADATACCSQGLEFIWEGTHTYPDDYPEPGTEVTVIGEFQTYEENGNLYCRLIDADLT